MNREKWEPTAENSGKIFVTFLETTLRNCRGRAGLVDLALLQETRQQTANTNHRHLIDKALAHIQEYQEDSLYHLGLAERELNIVRRLRIETISRLRTHQFPTTACPSWERKGYQRILEALAAFDELRTAATS